MRQMRRIQAIPASQRMLNDTVSLDVELVVSNAGFSLKGDHANSTGGGLET